MPWDALSNIMMHVFHNDTHPLSLSPGPMGTYLSMHLSQRMTRPSINSNHRSARYVPRNIVFIAARNTFLEMVHPP